MFQPIPPQDRNEPLVPETILLAPGGLESFQIMMLFMHMAHQNPTWPGIKILRSCTPVDTFRTDLPLSISLDSFVDLAQTQQLRRDMLVIRRTIDPKNETGTNVNHHWVRLSVLARYLPVLFDPPNIFGAHATVFSKRW